MSLITQSNFETIKLSNDNRYICEDIAVFSLLYGYLTLRKFILHQRNTGVKSFWIKSNRAGNGFGKKGVKNG